MKNISLFTKLIQLVQFFLQEIYYGVQFSASLLYQSLCQQTQSHQHEGVFSEEVQIQRRIQGCCNIQDGPLCDNSQRLEAVNYYHKAFNLGCCSSPRSASEICVKQLTVLKDLTRRSFEFNSLKQFGKIVLNFSPSNCSLFLYLMILGDNDSNLYHRRVKTNLRKSERPVSNTHVVTKLLEKNKTKNRKMQL